MLQGTRVADRGSLKEDDYTFFWTGRGNDEHREQGVGFGVWNTFLPLIVSLASGTERISNLLIFTYQGLVKFMRIYAPKLQGMPEGKDQFNAQHVSVVNRLPPYDHIYLPIYFNTRVEFLCFHKLCRTNTYFQNKACQKASWSHLMSNHWHKVDLVITRCESLQY